MQTTTVKKLAQIGILVAAEVVLSRFLSINTSTLKIGFGFVPIVLAAMLYGPVWGAVVAGLADFLGAVLFPIGPYFPGFTLTAMLVGAVYGLFLHKEVTLPRILGAVVVVSVPLHLLLNSFWISVLYDKGFLALLPGRIMQVAVMAPIQVLVIWLVATRLTRLLRSHI